MADDKQQVIKDTRSKRLQHVLAILIPLLGIIGIYIAGLAYAAPTSTGPLPDIGIIILCVSGSTLLVQAVLAWTLHREQSYLYSLKWLLPNKKILDERQKMVRQRAFERAYPLALLIAVLAMNSIFEMHMYSAAVKDSITVHICTALLIILMTLPAILAAFDKDS